MVGPLTSLAVGGAALGLWFVDARRAAADGRRGPGRRQPAGRRAQPGAGAAARRRPGAQGRGLGRDRQHAPRHHRRRAGAAGSPPRSCWPGRRPAGALRPAGPTSSTSCWRSSSRCSCGRGHRGADLGEGPPPAARPGRPRPGAPHPRRPRGPAARRGRPPRPGGRGGRHRDRDQQRRAGRAGQRGRAARHARGPPALGRDLDGRPARSTRGCACRSRSPGRTWSARSAGRPAAEYLLVEDDGSLYGVLATADVDRAFRRSSPQ